MKDSDPFFWILWNMPQRGFWWVFVFCGLSLLSVICSGILCERWWRNAGYSFNMQFWVFSEKKTPVLPHRVPRLLACGIQYFWAELVSPSDEWVWWNDFIGDLHSHVCCSLVMSEVYLKSALNIGAGKAGTAPGWCPGPAEPQCGITPHWALPTPEFLKINS